MKNAIITGASGMVGGIILRECLASPEIGKVTSIVRRASGIKHDKLTEIVHDNFSDFSSCESHFANQEVSYFCIGVYTGQASRDKFREITVDYTRAFAELLHQKSPGATFCFLSGQGADQSEKSNMMFARDKGIAENLLIKLGFGGLHIFRPGYIYPVEKRKEPNFSYRLMRRLYPIINPIFPKMSITSEVLAQAMFRAGIAGTDKVVLENEDIKKVIS